MHTLKQHRKYSITFLSAINALTPHSVHMHHITFETNTDNNSDMKQTYWIITTENVRFNKKQKI